MANELLSVIVANYNNRQYVPACLRSIFEQTYRPLEVVIYDDGSTDGSQDLIREFETNFGGSCKAILGAENRGVAIARHLAVDAAKGEFITTLDSDDFYYDPRKLEMEMDVLRNRREMRGEHVIAFSNIVVVDADGEFIRREGNGAQIKEGMIFEQILARSCMIPRDFVLPREAYYSCGGYDAKLKTHEDWDLKIRLARDRKFVYSGSDGTAYRRHAEGLSSTNHHARTRNLWKVFCKNIRIAEKERRGRVRRTFIHFMVRRDANYLRNIQSAAKGETPGRDSMRSRFEVKKEQAICWIIRSLYGYKSKMLVHADRRVQLK